jgi:hypothetical protein
MSGGSASARAVISLRLAMIVVMIGADPCPTETAAGPSHESRHAGEPVRSVRATNRRGRLRCLRATERHRAPGHGSSWTEAGSMTSDVRICAVVDELRRRGPKLSTRSSQLATCRDETFRLRTSSLVTTCTCTVQCGTAGARVVVARYARHPITASPTRAACQALRVTVERTLQRCRVEPR